MQQEKRRHPRLVLNSDLKAHITISRPFGDTVEGSGRIIDLSYSGIKIRLDTPLPEAISGVVKIIIILPESKIPLSIQGEIKRISPSSDYGLQYTGNPSEQALEQLLFECVKFTESRP
ncbi:MAG: PilZ domain-containing protein [Gammaproteobacteria bacterium]